jgi:alkylation response protein AidB-like acyl-CoA dehydrogenase
VDFELTDEQKDIIRAARAFAEGEFPEIAQECDQKEEFPRHLWKKACELGFVGVFIKEDYGGPGLGIFEHSLINEEFWRVDPGIGVSILAATFGSEMIQLFGTEKQKKALLPPLVKGEAITGAAITEPDAGSDVTSVVTRAVPVEEEYVINGTKTFTTNGTTARFKNKLGIRASETAELTFSDVHVPRENLVGEEGNGFHQFMAFFDHTRPHICAQAVGLAQGAMEKAVKHVMERRQFGKPLASFQATRFKIAEMATRIEAARNLYYKAAWMLDQGKPDSKLISMAKWYSGEVAVRVADEVVQLHGGYGYMGEYDVERFYRDAKIVEIYEGTKEIEKLIIARSILGKGASPS